jgi:GNAT superfamily N-acetyltransferase
MDIAPLAFDEALFAPLIADAEAEGRHFVRRLAEEWRDGTLRFDRPGELLLGARAGSRLLGVGGLSLDPYQPEEGLGRVRHLYVAAEARRQGIGRALMLAILGHARGRFRRLRLLTTTPDAARFYERLGFQASPGARQSHVLELGG